MRPSAVDRPVRNSRRSWRAKSNGAAVSGTSCGKSGSDAHAASAPRAGRYQTPASHEPPCCSAASESTPPNARTHRPSTSQVNQDDPTNQSSESNPDSGVGNAPTATASTSGRIAAIRSNQLAHALGKTSVDARPAPTDWVTQCRWSWPALNRWNDDSTVPSGCKIKTFRPPLRGCQCAAMVPGPSSQRSTLGPNNQPPFHSRLRHPAGSSIGSAVL